MFGKVAYSGAFHLLVFLAFLEDDELLAERRKVRRKKNIRETIYEQTCLDSFFFLLFLYAQAIQGEKIL